MIYHYEYPIIFDDHDGFASVVDDGAPSYRWPRVVEGNAENVALVLLAGPPLYGVPVESTVVAWR
jgi:hypothetical protein